MATAIMTILILVLTLTGMVIGMAPGIDIVNKFGGAETLSISEE
jgi:hypothetical protein